MKRSLALLLLATLCGPMLALEKEKNVNRDAGRPAQRELQEIGASDDISGLDLAVDAAELEARLGRMRRLAARNRLTPEMLDKFYKALEVLKANRDELKRWHEGAGSQA